MLAGQLERAGCVLPRSCSVASCGERFRPSQMRPRGRQQHAVRFLELAREPQVPVGLIVFAQDCGEQAQVHACVSPGGSTIPVELISKWLDTLVQDRAGIDVARLDCCIGVQHQRGQLVRRRQDVPEAVARRLLEDHCGVSSTVKPAQGPGETGPQAHDARRGVCPLLDHRDDLLATALGPDDEGKLDPVDQDRVGLPRLLPDLKGALGETLCGRQIAVKQLPARGMKRGEPLQRRLAELFGDPLSALKRCLGTGELPLSRVSVQFDDVRPPLECRVLRLGCAIGKLGGERAAELQRLGGPVGVEHLAQH